jgi:mono/diheme cytochrome c family protein
VLRVIAALALPLASSLLIAAATVEAQRGQGSAPSAPAAPTAQAAPKGDVENGKKIYTSYGCYQCHGYAAHGGPGPRLAPRPMAFAAFARYTRRPTGQMPPYTAKVVSDQEVADIYAFLLTIPPPPAVDSIPILAR